MKNTKHKLTLAQETLRMLTQQQEDSAKNAETTQPNCPTCSFALQNRDSIR